MAASLLPNMLTQVDYLGLAAIVVPVLVSLLGVAWRLGAVESKVNDVKEDVTEVKQDVRELRQVAGFKPRDGRR